VGGPCAFGGGARHDRRSPSLRRRVALHHDPNPIPSSRTGDRIIRVFRAGFGLALAAVLGATLTSCPREAAESKQPPRSLPVPVAVAAVEQNAGPVQIQAICTVYACS